jgi:hypothetical protein
MKFIKLVCLLSALFISACSSIMTNTEFYNPILFYLNNGNYGEAADQILTAEIEGNYSDKDRVLLHLDKGMIFHYQREYEKSNQEFEKAEIAIEDLYTKSISKGAASLLLNDNALDYSGEAYEDLYINVFKALNYLHLDDFDGAYVEIKRVNNKLNLLKTRYDEYVASLNSSDDAKIKIEAEELDYYNNVLSNYLSSLIFEADGEDDNARISLEKMDEAWNTYTDVYPFPKPSFLQDSLRQRSRSSKLNIISFTGLGPIKEPVGARITTFNDFITISDPTNFWIDAIPFPGIEYGWNFKFEFPRLISNGSDVAEIEIYIDSVYVGNLELLEDMSKVAEKTFETNKSIVFFKTITRAVLKGIGSSALGRELAKGKNEVVGDILAALTNAVVDATENADLRGWRTMPAYCDVTQIELPPGVYDVEIRFIDHAGNKLKSEFHKNFEVGNSLNLIETHLLR